MQKISKKEKGLTEKEKIVLRFRFFFKLSVKRERIFKTQPLEGPC